MNTDEQQTVAREIDQDLAALSRRAKEAHLDLLGYLIDMARLEAAHAARPH